MNVTKKGMLLATVLGVATLGAQSLMGQPAPVASPEAKGAQVGEAAGRPGRHMARRGKWMCQQLGLTPEQQKKVDELRQAMKTKAGPVRDQLRTKRSELQALWQAPSPDRAAIVAKMRELSALRDQMTEAQVDFRLGMSSVLTPEQRAKMKEMHGKRGQGKQGRRGGQGGRRGFGGGGFGGEGF